MLLKGTQFPLLKRSGHLGCQMANDKVQKESMDHQTKDHFPRLLPWLIVLLLIVASLVLYWPVLNHEFVDFDDPSYVTHNPHVRAGITPR